MKRNSEPASSSPRAIDCESSFQKALTQSPKPRELPRPLPYGHVTRLTKFIDIMDSGSLKPNYCRIHGRSLSYLFYGGLLYRVGGAVTRDSREFPIGLLFSPTIASKRDSYYPFDTGAMKGTRYGKRTGSFWAYKKNFRISARHDRYIARLLVHHLFGTNRCYLEGKVSSEARRLPEPVPQLIDFYNKHLGKADHRRAAIEALLERELPLNRELIWVGLPSDQLGRFFDFLDKLDGYVPRFYGYSPKMIFSPDAICCHLEHMAQKEVDRFVDSQNY